MRFRISSAQEPATQQVQDSLPHPLNGAIHHSHPISLQLGFFSLPETQLPLVWQVKHPFPFSLPRMSDGLQRIVRVPVTNTGTVGRLKKQTRIFRMEEAQGHRRIKTEDVRGSRPGLLFRKACLTFLASTQSRGSQCRKPVLWG